MQIFKFKALLPMALLAVMLSFILMSCLPRYLEDHPSSRSMANSSAPVPLMQTQSFDGWLFTWTNNEIAARDPKGFLEKSANTYAANDKLTSIEQMPSGSIAGHGLYTVGNPVDSRSYGNILVAVKWKVGQPIALFRAGISSLVQLEVIKAHFPGLLYNWIDARQSQWAMVVRSVEGLDLSSARSYDFRNGNSLRSLDPAKFEKDPRNPDTFVPWTSFVDSLQQTQYDSSGSYGDAGIPTAEGWNILFRNELFQLPSAVKVGYNSLPLATRKHFGDLPPVDFMSKILSIAESATATQNEIQIANEVLTATGYHDGSKTLKPEELGQKILARYAATPANLSSASFLFAKRAAIESAWTTYNLENLKADTSTFGLNPNDVLSTITVRAQLFDAPDGKLIKMLVPGCFANRVLTKDGWMQIQVTDEGANPSSVRGIKGWIKAQYVVNGRIGSGPEL